MNLIESYRKSFLAELRSGKYKIGSQKTHEDGSPVFEKEEDKDGACSCAIMGMMFGKKPNGHISLAAASKQLGLTSKDCL